MFNVDVGFAVAEKTSANVSATHSRVSLGDFAVSGSLFGPSAIVGYQWNWHPLTVRAGGGGRYTPVTSKTMASEAMMGALGWHFERFNLA